MNRLVYSSLWVVGIPFALMRLAWRARKQPDYLRNVSERFGAIARSKRPTLWIHAVSVGETRAAQPLIKALRGRFPDHDILLTHMTPTGRATGAELYGKDEHIRQCYLPYDLPWLVRRFLQRARPAVGIVMETEVWPNLLRAARNAGIPTLLVNARLSERSARGYSRLGQLSRQAFGDFTHIGAQAEADATRLRDCGATAVSVTGNMKFDVETPADVATRGDRFRAWANGRPVLLAASTREGEEDLLLADFARMATNDVLLVLVPRHPQRFDEVASMVERHGLSVSRRSQQGEGAIDTRVWLGDSMGEMAAYYRMADVCLMGGSWLPYGSQNLIEPCAAGVPVVLGPSTFNFADAAAKALAAGAAMQCDNVDAGVEAGLALLENAPRRAQMGEAGARFAAEHRGATARTLALIESALAGAPGG
ncbi:lipid IV(A) 3-deoxy-D-manno-octulosonic acid transferase [Uliginosibacterium sp. sgz301328]|uniref:lipid IV(A) 3-deoxy-D-manno-octulosonic acid transferase n=1 Tax=Uliginosibacterium sp. sgz301328 TaxID=3243764 RepID=UPI00359ECE6D